MSVKKEASGRRSIQVEVEVPGTPEEVWRAIATGPGISAWFVPTDFEERDGVPVAATAHFGPGMDAVAKVTEWDAPRRYATESGDMAPGAPPVATEWIVEPRAGGLCVVRVVHSLFASSEEWDDQLEGLESGWPVFFRILRLYLGQFPGERCANVQLAAFAPGPEASAWSALTGPLGTAGAQVGQRLATSSGAPPLSGQVEAAREGGHPHQLLKLDAPLQGLALLSACGMGDMVWLSVWLYLYGDQAADAAARQEPLWQAWMAERFPAPAADAAPADAAPEGGAPASGG
jgi:uncharacterized protein YndB with AHSA1/START domain